MKHWKTPLLTLAMGVLLFAAGCGQTGSEGPSTKDGKGDSASSTVDKDQIAEATPESAPTAKNIGNGAIVGFSQIGAESAWRTAETGSIRDEASKWGFVLKFSDGQGKQELQVAAIKSFISQGVKAIILAPKTEDGWDDVLRRAKRAGIPVILVDRGINVKDESLYATLICSDFVAEGRMAAEALIKEVDKRVPKSESRVRVIYELQGTTGSAPANDRMKGFHEVIDENPAFKVVESQTGDFNRTKGKEVMEGLLKKGIPDAVYAHNDDMALGAIQAIEAIGKKPGKDIVVVSIDGVRDALQALIEGKLNASVECNPLLGPFAYNAVGKLLKGEPVNKKTLVKDTVFDQARAKKEIATRKY